MARNRSMRRMRNRSRNRSKRGGWNLPWSEIVTFKKKLREIPTISDAMNNADTYNQYQLTEDDETEIVKKLGEYFNGLSDPDRSELYEQLTNAEKKKLYQQVYAVLNKNRLEDTPEADIVVKSYNVEAVAPDARVADPSYTSSTSSSPVRDTKARVFRTVTTNGPGGFKTNTQQRAGKSRRSRRARRTIKNRKSRKGRKMRRSYK